jgi:uncharacterized membrane protein
MRKRFAWPLAAVASTAIGYVALTLGLPYLMMGFALARTEREDNAGRNHIAHSQMVDERYGAASNYLFTRPNPDILYSACSYDLSSGPVLVGMRNHPEYGSIAFHARNTDNYAVINNRAGGYQTPEIEVLILAKGTPRPKGYSGLIVHSPTTRGMALMRTLMERRGDLPRYLALQRTHRCAPYK